MISSHWIQATGCPCTSDVTTFLYLSELTNVHPKFRCRPCTICQSFLHARHSGVCLYVCGWVCLTTYVHVSHRLFIYIFNSTIWKWTHVHMNSWKQTVWKPPVFTPDSTCWHGKQIFTPQKQLMFICVAFSNPCRLILNDHIELVSSYASPQLPLQAKKWALF